MRKENATFNTKFISEPGSYLFNADYFAFVELKDYACYVIADGIDTDDRKESAKLAVTEVIAQFSENPGISSGKMRRYIKAAHQTLLNEAQEIRLEASITILVTDYKKLRWAYAGNSRFYLLRNGSIKIATKDTSLTQRLADQEEIAIDQVAYHEERNNLYCYLGQPGHFSPIISKKVALADGDILLLQTRGVWENVGDAEIFDAIDGVSKPEEVCMGLEEVILSHQTSIIENYTIATIFVDKVYQNPKLGKRKKIFKICFSIAMALGALVLGITMAKMSSINNNMRKMEKYKDKGISYLLEYNYPSAKEQFAKAYEVTESLNVKPESEKGIQIECVEKYDTMSEYILLGLDAATNGKYKEAIERLNSAITMSEELQVVYEEAEYSYVSNLEIYKEYAELMLSAEQSVATTKYADATTAYEKAGALMESIGKTDLQDVAYAKQKDLLASESMSQGEAYEKKGKAYEEDDQLTSAIAMYESAQEIYKMALENYGCNSASDKLQLLEQKITAINALMKERSNAAILEEAMKVEQEADALAEEKRYEEAEEYANRAKELYMKSGSSDMASEMNSKIKEMSNAPKRETILAKMTEILEKTELGDTVEETQLYVSDTIWKLKELEKEAEEIGAQDIIDLIEATIHSIGCAVAQG